MEVRELLKMGPFRHAMALGRQQVAKRDGSVTGSPVRPYIVVLLKATQVKHILGSAEHSARAFELTGGDSQAVGTDPIERSRVLMSPVVVDVLKRNPNAPGGAARWGSFFANSMRPCVARP
ncbi:hypothetical protein ACN47A_01235 [Myxococcus fulvus]|uniref:hypothetical protein n=1 Tax=Myxococcus fulvus TaxID=33 RepID=UPI003B9D5083